MENKGNKNHTLHRETKHFSPINGAWVLKLWTCAGTETRLRDVRQIKKLRALVMKVFGG